MAILNGSISDLLSAGIGAGAVALGGILFNYAVKWARHKIKTVLVSEEAKFNIQIDAILTELRILTHCDRVTLLRFHNGGKYFDGTAMKKMSCTNVSVAHGIDDEAKSRQDMTVTLFGMSLSHALEDVGDITIVKDMPESFCRTYFEMKHVKAFSSVSVKLKDKPIGILAVHYCADDELPNIANKARVDELIQAKLKLEYLLASRAGY